MVRVGALHLYSFPASLLLYVPRLYFAQFRRLLHFTPLLGPFAAERHSSVRQQSL